MKIKGLLLALVLPIVSPAQNTHPVKFQTPEVTAFNRSIETPVSLSTGIPNISIPLYEIKIRGVSIPVTLNYSGGGIKVDEEATWVGLGWNLNYGGQISRKQRGAKDEKYFLRTLEYGNSAHSIAHYLTLPNYGADPFLTEKANKIGYAKNQMEDYMPDEFYYSALGYSGRMMFKQAQNKFVLFPKEDIKVDYTLSNVNLIGHAGEYRLDSWDLKLPNGTTVNYGTYGASTDAMNGADPETRNSWGIKNVRNIYDDQVTFNYEPITYTTYNLASETYNMHSMDDYPMEQQFNYFVDQTTYRTNYLNEITFPGGRLEFVTSSRSDMATKALSVINVYDGNHVLVKKIEFVYNYFSGNFNQMSYFQSDDYSTKRLKLEKIKISAPNVQVMEYKFDYYNSIYNSPSKHSYAQDFWGFFNAVQNTTLIPKTITSWGAGNNFGANRLPSPNANQVFSLKTIHHPEGGRTEYTYECNTAHAGLNIPSYFLTPGSTSESFYVGGIRIKSIKNFNNDGVIATQKNYNYLSEVTGNTSGWLLSLPTYYENTRKAVNDPYGAPDTKYDIRLFATSRSPLQTTGGSFVGYETVTEEQVGLSTDTLKSVHYYSFHDAYHDVDSRRSESEIIDSKEWLRGKLDSTKILKNNVPVKRERYEYYKISPHHTFESEEDFVDEINTDFISWQTLSGTYRNIQDFYDGVENLKSVFRYAPDAYPASLGNFSVMPYFKRYTGFDKPLSKKTINYLDAGVVEQTEHYYYDSTPIHHQLTRSETTSSKGEIIKNTTKYPADFSGLVPYTTMVQYNIMNTPIEAASFKGNSLLEKKKTNYVSSWLHPDNDQMQIGANPLETKTTYIYNNKHDLQEAQQSDGIKRAYLWDDISHQYPTAEVLNAASNDVAYTSFEISEYLIYNGSGGWFFAGYADKAQANIPVGKWCFPTTASTSFTKTGLTPSRSYTVSYWCKNGPYTVNGSQSVTQGEVVNGWTYFIHKVSGVSAISVTGTAGYIDELKLCPSESMMTTANYTSLGLMTAKSVSDEKNIYYDYDGIGRLKTIKDQNRNIVKNYETSYRGEAPTIYQNTEQSQSFSKTGCIAGTVTSPIIYTVFANTYSSTISQADADLKALNDINLNGQNYANTQGICLFYSTVKSGSFTRSACEPGYIGSSLVYTVPAGAFSSTISQADADSKAQNDLDNNGQNFADLNGQCVVSSPNIDVLYHNQTVAYWTVTLTNVSTSAVTTRTMGANYNGTLISGLASGIYNISFNSGGLSVGTNPIQFNVNGTVQVANPISPVVVSFNNVSINSASTTPLISIQ